MSSVTSWTSVFLSVSLVGNAACNAISGVGDFDFEQRGAAGGAGGASGAGGGGGGGTAGGGGSGGSAGGGSAGGGSAGGPSFCVSSPVDEFDRETLSPSWIAGETSGPLAYLEGGQLVFEIADGAAGQYASIVSTSTYDLTSCHLVIEVVSGFAGDSKAYAHFTAITTDGTYIEMGIAGTQLDIKLGVGAGPRLIQSVPYDPTTPLFIAFGESSGEVRWETSPDGRAWTTLHTEPLASSVSGVTLAMGAGTSEVVSADPPLVARFDNLNVLP